MPYIQNLFIDNDICQFDLDNSSNEIKISLANALRRTMIANIDVFAIDMEKITFFENNTIYSNEFLKHRLSLIPVISNIDNLNYDNVLISCKKKNNDEIIDNILVKDFVVKDVEKDSIIDNNTFFKFPNILFAKLKTNNFLSFECKLIKNNAENGGSFFSSVCGCIYTFKMDDKEINTITKNMSENEKRSFMCQDNERVYEKNKIGDPKVYKFNVEITGFYDIQIILRKSINELMNKLENIKNEFKNLENSNIITLRDDLNDINNFYNFLIDNENETLGQLVTTYCTDDKNISYCGYIIEHPLKKNILFKIKLADPDKNKDIKNIIITISENIDYLINLLNKMLNDI